MTLMTESLLALLLATAGEPALAVDEDGGRADRAERSEIRQARPGMRLHRTPRMERSIVVPSIEQADEAPAPIQRPQRAIAGHRWLERASPRLIEVEPVRRTAEPRREAAEPRAVVRQAPRFVEVEQRDAADSVREWRRAERERGRAAGPALIKQRTDTGWEPLRKRPEARIEEAAGIGERRAPRISRVPVEGSQPPARAAASRITTNHWRGDWRSDRRYDWRDHRRRHRSLFRFGFYYDPFGWRYRPYSIGWRLWPSYYHSRYWLHDAWTYRLPYAPPGYRWIRYYDDALLVDTWDGRVVDVIRNFFW